MAKQARDLKSKMKKTEKELKKVIVEGFSADNTVKVSLDGKMEFRMVTISPDLIKEGNVKLIEKNIGTAIESALKKAQKINESTMSDLSKKIHIPGLTDQLQ